MKSYNKNIKKYLNIFGSLTTHRIEENTIFDKGNVENNVNLPSQAMEKALNNSNEEMIDMTILLNDLPPLDTSSSYLNELNGFSVSCEGEDKFTFLMEESPESKINFQEVPQIIQEDQINIFDEGIDGAKNEFCRKNHQEEEEKQFQEEQYLQYEEEPEPEPETQEEPEPEPEPEPQEEPTNEVLTPLERTQFSDLITRILLNNNLSRPTATDPSFSRLRPEEPLPTNYSVRTSQTQGRTRLRSGRRTDRRNSFLRSSESVNLPLANSILSSIFSNETTRNREPSSQTISLDKFNESVEFINYTENMNNNEVRCPISLEEFEVSEVICRIKNCSHIFKINPLISWMKVNTYCPVCRYDLNVQSGEPTTPSPPSSRRPTSQSETPGFWTSTTIDPESSPEDSSTFTNDISLTLFYYRVPVSQNELRSSENINSSFPPLQNTPIATSTSRYEEPRTQTYRDAVNSTAPVAAPPFSRIPLNRESPSQPLRPSRDSNVSSQNTTEREPPRRYENIPMLYEEDESLVEFISNNLSFL
jgi:hypothetical protein